MSRLPQPGSDDGNWGEILNDYLSQSLASDGTLKNGSVTSGKLAPGAIAGAITKSDVGLGNADNTSDANKPISTPTKNYVDTGLSSKASDAAVLHLAGTESVTGNKIWGGTSTFNATLTANNQVALLQNLRYGVAATRTTTLTLSTSSVSYNPADASSGAFTLTLPTTSTAGIQFTIQKIDSSANIVTVAGTINGATNFILDKQWDLIVVQSTGTPNSYTIVTSSKLSLLSVSDILPVGSGGTGSATQNFVDLTSDQTISGEKTFNGPFTLADGANLGAGSTDGTQIGTAATQKLGFYGATPVVRPASTLDLGNVLSNLGLRTAGAAYPLSTSGAVTFNGAFRLGYTPRTSNTTLTPGSNAEFNPVDATTGGITVTLNATINGGTKFTIKKTDASTNAVTITTSGGTGTIDNAANYILSGQNDYVTVVSTTNSGAWLVISAKSGSTTQNFLDLSSTGQALSDGKNIELGTTTGTQIGTATTQKLGFYGATPITQPTATTELGGVLSNLGLRASGNGYSIAMSGNFAQTGSFRQGVNPVTGTFSMTTSSAQYQSCTAASTAYSVTLPASSTAGTLFTIFKADATAFPITVVGTIGGFTNFVLASQNDSVTVMTTGTSGVFTLVNSTKAPAHQNVNAQTGTAYTLVSSDAGQLITLNNAAAIALTVPTNATAYTPVGASIDLIQMGLGQVTVTGASGVTVNGTPGLKLTGQYAAASLVQVSANNWVLVGSLAA